MNIVDASLILHGPRGADIAARCQAKREREAAAAERGRTSTQLLADIAEGIRVLRERDGSNVTEAQVDERARNIVAGLMGNFEIKERP